MKLMRLALNFALFALASSYAFAQTKPAKSPYVGEESRAIKALSPDEVKGYQEGKGLGYARTAELNGFPGPMHVLELADKLKLTADQKTKSQKIFDAMKSRSIAIGEKIVAKESELEKLFSSENVDKENLKRVSNELYDAYRDYRISHLEAHIEQKKILSESQIKEYETLRGYDAHAHSPSGHGDGKHHGLH